MEIEMMRQAAMIEERLRQDQLAAEKSKRERDAFLRSIADALRPVIRQELEAVMATKTIGRVDPDALAKGKVQPKPSRMPLHRKIAAKAKADRKEAGLRANAAKRKGAA
jgi:hypothetical protein